MAMMVIAPGGLLRMAGTDGEGRALGALRQLEEQKRVAKAKAQEEEKDRAEGKAEEEEVVVAAQNVELPILASYSVAFDDVPLTDEQQEWVDVILTRLARCIAVSLRKSEPILPIFKKQKWMKVVRTPVWLLSLLAQKHCARALDRGVCMDSRPKLRAATSFRRRSASREQFRGPHPSSSFSLSLRHFFFSPSKRDTLVNSFSPHPKTSHGKLKHTLLPRVLSLERLPHGRRLWELGEFPIPVQTKDGGNLPHVRCKLFVLFCEIAQIVNRYARFHRAVAMFDALNRATRWRVEHEDNVGHALRLI